MVPTLQYYHSDNKGQFVGAMLQSRLAPKAILSAVSSFCRRQGCANLFRAVRLLLWPSEFLLDRSRSLLAL